MTVRDLRECLYEIKDQEQEISEDNIVELMMLWTKRNWFKKKIKFLRENDAPVEFINGWVDEKDKITEEIKNYIG